MIARFVAVLMSLATAGTADPVVIPWDGGVGGLSAIDVSDDGRQFVVLSDRGKLITGELLREGDRLIGLRAQPALPLRGPTGQPLGRDHYDSEGIAFAPDGNLYVSYEGRHRVWVHDRRGRFRAAIPDYAAFADLAPNGSLEGLAAQGRTLWTLPESPQGDTVPIWARDGRGWHLAARLPKRDSPVGADFGPDGALYVLERRFFGPSFGGQVRRIDLGTGQSTTVLTLPLGRHGNLEGLAVWRGQDGRLRLTMVSDDNQLSWLRSDLVEYTLP